jgi:hypothetical protein
LITSSPVNHGSQTTSTDFRNKIGHKQTSGGLDTSKRRSLRRIFREFPEQKDEQSRDSG